MMETLEKKGRTKEKDKMYDGEKGEEEKIKKAKRRTKKEWNKRKIRREEEGKTQMEV